MFAIPGAVAGIVAAVLVFSVLAATLLTYDAFANVVGAQQGRAFEQAIFYLLVGEIPSIILALWVARCAARKWQSDDRTGTAA